MENNSLINGRYFYDAGIFLDNDKDNVKTVASCGEQMKTILIPCAQNPWVSLQSPVMLEYVSSLSPEGREAANTIHMLTRAATDELERYDPTSGIKDEHVEEVKNWVLLQRANTPNKRLAALFDWDRTLSIIEGFWSFGSDGLAGFPAALEERLNHYPSLSYVIQRWDTMTPEAVTEYYCGGPERVRMLQEMFDFLYDNQVDIYILTYNPTCETNRPFLEEMTHVLTRNRRAGYLCASVQKGIDKKMAIQGSAEYGMAFSYICPNFIVAGNNENDNLLQLLGEFNNAIRKARGGFKKKTMKRKKQRRMTRKKLNKRSAK